MGAGVAEDQASAERASCARFRGPARLALGCNVKICYKAKDTHRHPGAIRRDRWHNGVMHICRAAAARQACAPTNRTWTHEHHHRARGR